MSTAITVFLVVVTTLLVLGAAVFAVASVWLGRLALRHGRVARGHVRAGWSHARAAVASDAQAVRAQRARLDREFATTTGAWESGRRMLDRSARKQLGGAYDVLARTSRQLAYELAIAAADPDHDHRASWLTDLRFRVDAFVTACGSFRQGILLAAGAYGDAAGVAATAVVLDLNRVDLDKEPAAAR